MTMGTYDDLMEVLEVHRKFLEDGSAMIYNKEKTTRIFKCSYCGQNGSIEKPCRYCGAPIEIVPTRDSFSGYYWHDFETSPITPTYLNIRDEPSIESNIVGCLVKGDRFQIFRELHGWAKIGKRQWVSKTLLTNLGFMT